MPKINDGGPAFPVAFQHVNKTDGTIHSQEWAGLSLRDYFAATALTGCVEKAVSDVLLKELGSVEAVCERIAIGSYAIADAMLKERSRSNG